MQAKRECFFSFLSAHTHTAIATPSQSRTEHVNRQITRECIKQSVPVVAGADGVDEGVTEGAGEDAFRGLVDSCHGELSDEDSDKKH